MPKIDWSAEKIIKLVCRYPHLRQNIGCTASRMLLLVAVACVPTDKGYLTVVSRTF